MVSEHLYFVSHSSFYVKFSLLAELNTLLQSFFNSAAGERVWFQGRLSEKVKPSPALMQHKHHTYRDKP